jgi:CRP-like cAMP-binding protein
MRLLDAVGFFLVISPESRKQLEGLIVERHLPKGYHLLNFGEVDDNMNYIQKGSGRIYYYRNGQEITDLLAMDYQFLGGVGSLFTKEPSNKAIELCEDSIIETVNMTSFEALCQDNIELERLARKMTAYAFLFCQKTIEDIRYRSAKERYLDLTTMYRGIENRIPLKHLASYLGISQVSLSRIRSGKQ